MAIRVGLGILALNCVATGSAGAQSTSDDGAAALQPLIACRAVTPDAAKLSCYEAAARTLEEQVRDKRVRMINRRDLREAKRSLFGLTLPRIDLFGNDNKEDEFSELNTTIVSAMPLGNDRVQLQVAEGSAIWSTTEPLPFIPREGTKIRIRKGPMGGYFIAITGARSVRGIRLR